MPDSNDLNRAENARQYAGRGSSDLVFRPRTVIGILRHILDSEIEEGGANPPRTRHRVHRFAMRVGSSVSATCPQWRNGSDSRGVCLLGGSESDHLHPPARLR